MALPHGSNFGLQNKLLLLIKALPILTLSVHYALQ